MVTSEPVDPTQPGNRLHSVSSFSVRSQGQGVPSRLDARSTDSDDKEEDVMAQANDPGRRPEAPIDGPSSWPTTTDPLEIDTADMGFQIGLMDTAGIAAMMTGGIPR
jgi:hypothetical protein